MSDTQFNELKACERFVNLYRSLTLRQSPFRNRADLLSFKDQLLETLGIFSARKGSTKTLLAHKGRSIIRRVTSPFKVTIHPAKKIKSMSPVTIPNYTLESTDMAWFRLGLDAAWEKWEATSDIPDTFVSIARTVDDINKRILGGERSPSFCHCTPAMSKTEIHTCGGCGNETLCEFLETSQEGLRMCPGCSSKARDERSLSHKLAWRSLKENLRIDYKRMGRSSKSDSFKDTLRIAWAKIHEMVKGEQGTSYIGYSGQRQQPSPTAHNPLSISIDAAFPLAIDNFGRIGRLCDYDMQSERGVNRAMRDSKGDELMSPMDVAETWKKVFKDKKKASVD
ncbi:hypothetical protein F4819DRAFT_424559 [Hypoxylon fuscum]|nr:hypothetical protein F4819DRAFT_424559 [Hypoxylon fuscum]